MSSTNNTLSIYEYLEKIDKLKSKAIQRHDWVKARSYQLKIDNANQTTEKRGNINQYIIEANTPSEKPLNKKERRAIKLSQRMNAAAASSTASPKEGSVVSQKQSQDPRKSADDKAIKAIQSAARDLFNFLKSGEAEKVIKWSVNNNDSIVIYSIQKIDLPSVYRNYAVINKIAKENEVLK